MQHKLVNFPLDDIVIYHWYNPKLISICFFFHQAIESRSPYRLMQSLTHFTIWTSSFYFFCNSGEEVNSRFAGISDTIYDCPWHELPVKLRKCLHIMMCISQKPIIFQGVNTVCNRTQFTRVCVSQEFFFVRLRKQVEIAYSSEICFESKSNWVS